MKKVIAGLLMSATVLGLATFATNAVSVHAADDTTTDPLKATNNANLTVKAGTLSFTEPGDVAFPETDVQTVYTDGYDKTVEGTDYTTTVSDFLGDNKDWTLTATAVGFGNSVLDDDQQSNLTLNGSKLNKGQSATVKTGNAGVTPIDLSYNLTIKKETLLTADSYTSKVNWSLSNVPAAAGETN